jgi:ATP-dependent helicase/nuclease subunit A
MTKRRRLVPPETILRQSRASDPASSAWVSANAGSGKTHVLSQRVVRLLLDDVEPSKILCLTYTRAAAANMANRVFRDLSAWSLMGDAALSETVAKLTGSRPGAEKLALARRLFARALETPGGLKIQTIHAFCEAVLQQFPLEANIAGHFEMLDAEMEAALVAEARRDLISGAAGGHDARLAEAFADVLARAGEFGLDELLSDIVRKRDALRGFIDEVGHDDPPYAALFEEFGLEPGDTAETIARGAWPLPGFDSGFVAALDRAVEGIAAARFQNDVLPHLKDAFREADPVRRLELACNGLLTAKGEPYGPSAFTKALVGRLPELPGRYDEAAIAAIAALDRMALVAMLSSTRSALVLADWLIGRYERLKSGRGFLDFNDLIDRTVRLLSRDEASAWVQYKLDRGVDHILIDEAQDTSPQQWEVVKKLAAEFFAGQGARDRVRRTIFAVGDEKQSIYSFQGAEPAAFAESRVEFRSRVADAQGAFEDVRLLQSFRSTREVLSAVDLVFTAEERRQGLTRDAEPIVHEGIRDEEPGYVELWSSLGPVEVEEPDDWTEAIDHASAPAARLAEAIADTIAGWIRGGEILEGQGRRVRAGDILVLVRKRDSFVHALTRALKDKKRAIPVAGADRLLLTDHIAVKDLLAIARFALQPHDDLSLAALLRSPIFGLSEEELFEFAWKRGTASLFSAMRQKAAANPRLRKIVATLEEWRNEAAFRPSFEFYASVLAGTPERPGARCLLVARLGAEAGDIIDEFLSFCLTVEQTGGDGLEALLATLDTAAPEIKREMDQRRDEVRILTVHASKGLEAPIVFLVDSGGKPFVEQHLPRLLPVRARGDGWRGDGFLWRCGAETTNSVSRGIADGIARKAEEEYRRLLYVGMTRAEDRLIVCGYHGARGRPANSWHSMVEAGLAEAALEERQEPQACLPVRRYRVTDAPPLPLEVEEERQTAAIDGLPAALVAPLPPIPPLPRPLKPSGAALVVEASAGLPLTGVSPVLAPGGDDSPARGWGTAIHRLLQVLPDLPPAEREAATLRYLESFGPGGAADEASRVWNTVSAILSDAQFASIFAPGSRAEVAVMGTVEVGGRPRTVSGKIDRLAVSDGEVLIVDYKTGRAPAGIAEAPPEHIAQLALYRALLQPLYPGREVRAALLYTAAPRLLPVDAAAMDAALARLTHS